MRIANHIQGEIRFAARPYKGNGKQDAGFFVHSVPDGVADGNVGKGVHPIVIVISCFVVGIVLNYFGILAV